MPLHRVFPISFEKVAPHVSSADEATDIETIPTTSPHLKTANHSSAVLTGIHYTRKSLLKAPHRSESVPSGTSLAGATADMVATAFIPAVSVEMSTLRSSDILRVHALGTEGSISEVCLKSHPEGLTTRSFPINNHLVYRDFSSDIHLRPRLPSMSPTDCEIFERVVHPYDIPTFQMLLDKHHLTSAYPLLVKNLSSGFPLGILPLLKHSIIIKNHPSVDRFPVVVEDYINAELNLQRMSGPFTKIEVERIMRGPFYSSPFIVSEQDQGPGMPQKYRVCRHLSKSDPISGMPSVNSFICKDDFPTRFDMAFKVAEEVSNVFLFQIILIPLRTISGVFTPHHPWCFYSAPFLVFLLRTIIGVFFYCTLQLVFLSMLSSTFYAHLLVLYFIFTLHFSSIT